MRSLLVSLLVTSSLALAANDATATLRNQDGARVGTVTFSTVEGGVRVRLKVSGVTPGQHAFHVHAKGLCEGDFTSAGGHFNPLGKEHGLQNPKGAHLGDLPNIVVDEKGAGFRTFVIHGATLEAGETSLFPKEGTALVLHEAADDLKTDPAGNAGPRIACGVIERAIVKPK